MSAQINSDVNQFPTLTWNHLNINRTHLEAAITDAAVPDFDVAAAGVNLRQIPRGRGTVLPPRGESGLGREFDGQFDAACTAAGIPLNEFSVEPGSSEGKPVRISCHAADGSAAALDTLILAGEGSCSTFIFDFTSEKNATGVLGSRIEVRAEEGAVVHVVTVNLLGSGFVHFDSVASTAADGAHISLTQLELGAAQVYTGNYETLAGDGSRFDGRLGYLVRQDHFLDVNYVSRQEGRSTSSTMSADGVVADSARKTWRGTIDFRKGCEGATGDEQENVLLMSPTVVNKTLPVILCDEESVEGRHGASIGRLGKDILFYMQSRGISEKDAEKLMIRAKISSVCRDIPDEALVAAVQEFLEGAV
ncbi:MAG TPA: hypothetical protein DDW78_01575 [Treponema sp.]|nr:hypothetical protein [Treponema sp.]